MNVLYLPPSPLSSSLTPGVWRLRTTQVLDAIEELEEMAQMGESLVCLTTYGKLVLRK